MRYVIILFGLLMLSVAGCANLLNKYSADLNKATVSSFNLQQDLDTADSEADNIATVDKTNQGLQAHVVSLKQAIKSGKDKLPNINKGIESGKAAVAADVADKKTINALESRFWSPRQVRDWHWFILTVSALSVAFIILDFLSSAGNPIGIAAMVAFHTLATICTVGLNWIIPWVGKFNNWLWAKAITMFHQIASVHADKYEVTVPVVVSVPAIAIPIAPSPPVGTISVGTAGTITN